MKVILERMAGHTAHHPTSKIYAGEAAFTYGELLNLSAELAAEIPSGVHLAIACDCQLGYLVGLLACLWSGAVAVPISTANLESPRTVELLRKYNVSLVLSDRPEAVNLPFPTLMFNPEVKRYTAKRTSTGEHGPAVLLQTSGTTEDPRAPLLTEFALSWNALRSAERLGLTQDDVGLVTLPLTYSFGLNVTLAHLLVGATLVLPKREPFMPGSFYRTVRQYGVTVTALVASQIYTLISARASTRRMDWPLRAVLYAGGATPVSWVKQLAELWPGTKFLQGYGLTEAGPRVSMHDFTDESFPLESAGRPLPGVEVAVLRDGVISKDPNIEGELLVRTPSRMIAYYRNDAATQRVFLGEWLRTGDLGYQDERGFVYIRGRLKSLVKVGGRSVYPEEVEQVLLELPGVRDCRAYGYPDEALGQVVAVDIVSDVTDDSVLRAHCQKHLEAFKVPRLFRHVPAIERNENGKIRRG